MSSALVTKMIDIALRAAQQRTAVLALRVCPQMSRDFDGNWILVKSCIRIDGLSSGQLILYELAGNDTSKSQMQPLQNPGSIRREVGSQSRVALHERDVLTQLMIRHCPTAFIPEKMYVGDLYDWSHLLTVPAQTANERTRSVTDAVRKILQSCDTSRNP